MFPINNYLSVSCKKGSTTDAENSQMKSLNKRKYTETYVDSDEEDETIVQLLNKIKSKYKNNENNKSRALPKKQKTKKTTPIDLDNGDGDVKITTKSTTSVIDLTDETSVDRKELEDSREISSNYSSKTMPKHSGNNKTRGDVETFKKVKKGNLSQACSC